MGGFLREWCECEVVNPAGRNMRFWAYPMAGRCQEAVRLTLRPGDDVVFQSWGRHEEGWERRFDRYSYDGERVVRECCDDGTDCDGRLTRSGEEVMVSASGSWNPHAKVDYPVWKKVSSRQRDYEAEKAGY